MACAVGRWAAQAPWGPRVKPSYEVSPSSSTLFHPHPLLPSAQRYIQLNSEGMSQVLLLQSLFILCSFTQVSSASFMKNLVTRWMMYKDECLQNNSRESPVTGLVCNRTFNKYACWPDGLPNTTVSVPCPWYLPWYRTVQQGLVYLDCDAGGQWAKQSNASECELNDPVQKDMQYYGKVLGQFRTMYTVGYSLSLGALVLALGILVAFRKLHCMRNNIHMNLFASFILRASSILIKDVLLDRPHLNIDPDITTDLDMEQLMKNETAIGCRVAMVMMQYSVIANSYWLLVEGIYLHNLLAVTFLTEGNHLGVYLCIGWGAPLIFVLPWIIVKYLYENENCWEQNLNMEYWWIIRSSILLAVLINFLIFIHIIKILMSKLRAHQMRYSDYKLRLAKSTLTLIPLLGSHLVLFSFVTDESTSNGANSLRLTKLFIDLFFSSFQGLLVAILYCFVNKEVQSEIVKRWKRWKLGKDIEEEYRHTYSNTVHVPTSVLVHHAPAKSDVTHMTSALPCPEEKNLLRLSCQNGTGIREKGCLQSISPPQEGAQVEEPTLGHNESNL